MYRNSEKKSKVCRRCGRDGKGKKILQNKKKENDGTKVGEEVIKNRGKETEAFEKIR